MWFVPMCRRRRQPRLRTRREFYFQHLQPRDGMGANLVFGQGGSFTSGACDFDSPNGSAEDLCNPSGTAVDVNGNLYVADTQNNRVLEYDQPVIAPTPTATATATATATTTITAT